MSELDQWMRQRRSIRDYSDQIPSREMVQTLISAAAAAPSPSNSKPVRFVQIGSIEKREALKNAMEKNYHGFLEKREALGLSRRLNNWINAYWRFSRFMFNAPILMAVGTCTESAGFREKLASAGLLDRSSTPSGEMEITVGTALQNYMLKAEEIGLNTCVLTAPLVFVPAPEKILEVDQVMIKCFLTTGYAMAKGTSHSPLPPLNFFSEI